MARSLINKVLVPVDGSEFSRRAAAYAIWVAKEARAKVVALHVVHLPAFALTYPAAEGISPVAIPTPLPLEIAEDERKVAQKIVDEVKKMGVEAGVAVETKIIERQPSIPDAIIQFAGEQGVDLIVMGTKGKTAIKRFFLGSVTESVVHHAHCPVLVVR